MKRRYPGNDDIVDGYIQQVSAIKQSSSSSTRYFDGTIQTRNDFVRFVCFSTEKYDSFQSASAMKSPVKLNNVQISPNKGKQEVLVQKQSNLQICKSLDFTMKSTVPSTKVPLTKIKDLTTANIVIKKLQEDDQDLRVRSFTKSFNDSWEVFKESQGVDVLGLSQGLRKVKVDNMKEYLQKKQERINKQKELQGEPPEKKSKTDD